MKLADTMYSIVLQCFHKLTFLISYGINTYLKFSDT